MKTLNSIADVKPFQKPQDSIFAKLFNRRLSRVFTFYALKFFPNISPSQVSALSFLVSAIGIACFLSPEYWVRLIGIVILQIGFSLDCSDGEIARIQNTMSPFGAWLDSVLDRFKELLMIAALTASWYLYHEQSIWVIILGATSIALWQVIAYLREAKKSSWPTSRTAELFVSKEMYVGTVDTTIYLVCGAVLVQWEIAALWIFFAASLPLIAKQIRSAMKMRG
jgi:phosphatidylglycerophosphate synthase